MRAAAVLILSLLATGCESIALEDVRARDLAWIAGNWEGTDSDGQRIEEIWSEPAEGTITGEHRQIAADKQLVLGSMRIVSGAGGVVLLGTLDGESTRRYGLVEFGRERALFRAREARYPAELEFRRSGNRMTVLARGDVGLGNQREVRHELTRVR